MIKMLTRTTRKAYQGGDFQGIIDKLGLYSRIWDSQPSG